MEIKDYQSACLDFLNGHMLITDSQKFAHELEHNRVLAEELAEVKQWQAHLQVKQQDNIVPDFGNFEAKLAKSHWGSRQNWGYSLVAATSFILLIYVGIDSNSHTINHQFETLTSPNVRYAKPVVQIVLANNVNVEQFIAEYALKIVESTPNSQIIIVEHTTTFEDDFLVLSADSRTVFVKKIEKTQ